MKMGFGTVRPRCPGAWWVGEMDWAGVTKGIVERALPWWQQPRRSSASRLPPLIAEAGRRARPCDDVDAARPRHLLGLGPPSAIRHPNTKLDALALLEAPEALGLDLRLVHEQVPVCGVVRDDEPKAPGELLDRAGNRSRRRRRAGVAAARSRSAKSNGPTWTREDVRPPAIEDVLATLQTMHQGS